MAQASLTDLQAGGGLQALMQAVTTAGHAPGAQAPGLAAQGEHDVANADQTAASPDRQVTPRVFEGGPDIKDLIMPRLQAARNISNTNKNRPHVHCRIVRPNVGSHASISPTKDGARLSARAKLRAIGARREARQRAERYS